MPSRHVALCVVWPCRRVAGGYSLRSKPPAPCRRGLLRLLWSCCLCLLLAVLAASARRWRLLPAVEAASAVPPRPAAPAVLVPSLRKIGATVVAPSNFQFVRPKAPVYKDDAANIPHAARAHTPARAHPCAQAKPPVSLIVLSCYDSLKLRNMTTPDKINVLIACEESQAETLAFRERGFNAFSCDLQHARYNQAYHIQGDVTPLLQGATQFITQDGTEHTVNRFHLVIAHPPCTYLSKVGSMWLYKDPVVQVDTPLGSKYLNLHRYRLMQQAREFFMLCLNTQAEFLAVENPIPMRLAMLPRPDCYLHPSWFGVKYTKKTLYWLRNLPPIMPELLFPQPKCFVTNSRGKYRSRTFPQVAAALARQWGDYVLQHATP